MFNRTGCVFCPNNSTLMVQYIQRNMPIDLRDMNYALALDLKKHPGYSERIMDFFKRFNLHKNISQSKIKEQAYFRKIAFNNMEFAKGSPGASEYITDLRGKVPIEKKDIPKNNDFVIEA